MEAVVEPFVVKKAFIIYGEGLKIEVLQNDLEITTVLNNGDYAVMRVPLTSTGIADLKRARLYPTNFEENK